MTIPYVPIDSDEIINVYDQSSLPIHNYPNDKSQYSIDIFPDELIFSNDNSQTILIRNNGYDTIDNIELIIVGTFIIKSISAQILEPDQTLQVQVAYDSLATAPSSGGLYVDKNNLVGKQFIKLSYDEL